MGLTVEQQMNEVEPMAVKMLDGHVDITEAEASSLCNVLPAEGEEPTVGREKVFYRDHASFMQYAVADLIVGQNPGRQFYKFHSIVQHL